MDRHFCGECARMKPIGILPSEDSVAWWWCCHWGVRVPNDGLCYKFDDGKSGVLEVAAPKTD